MPKGQSPKLKGAICNVPIDVDNITTVLPRPVNNNGILVVKLKRKLEYKGYVLFEPIRPAVVNQALMFLKTNNPLYHNIEINSSNIPNFDSNGARDKDEEVDFDISTSDLTLNELLVNNMDEEIPVLLEKDDGLEMTINPLDKFRTNASETALMSHQPSNKETRRDQI